MIYCVRCVAFCCRVVCVYTRMIVLLLQRADYGIGRVWRCVRVAKVDSFFVVCAFGLLCCCCYCRRRRFVCILCVHTFRRKQAAVSSAPVLTHYNFDWTVREVGSLMAVLGLLVLPVNVVVGRMSLVYEDRRVVLVLSCKNIVVICCICVYMYVLCVSCRTSLLLLLLLWNVTVPPRSLSYYIPDLVMFLSFFFVIYVVLL